MSQAKIILVAGPTASGKSAFALDLALKRNGTIINADASQIYAGLPVLSAHPDAAALKAAPHRLYGALPLDQACSAGLWVGLARQAIADTVNEGRTPILVGGTGLYFRALLGGLADIPPIPPEIRIETMRLYDQLGEEEFRKRLATHDPAAADRIARNDRQRLIRAYEVVTHTGHPLDYWHQTGEQPHGYDPEPHVLMPDRAALYAACDKRFLTMIHSGALDEARAVMALNLPAALPAMKTLGLRELIAHLRGDLSLNDAITHAQQATRNYAKRQMTWFRNQWGADAAGI